MLFRLVATTGVRACRAPLPLRAPLLAVRTLCDTPINAPYKKWDADRQALGKPPEEAGAAPPRPRDDSSQYDRGERPGNERGGKQRPAGYGGERGGRSDHSGERGYRAGMMDRGMNRERFSNSEENEIRTPSRPFWNRRTRRDSTPRHQGRKPMVPIPPAPGGRDTGRGRAMSNVGIPPPTGDSGKGDSMGKVDRAELLQFQNYVRGRMVDISKR